GQPMPRWVPLPAGTRATPRRATARTAAATWSTSTGSSTHSGGPPAALRRPTASPPRPLSSPRSARRPLTTSPAPFMAGASARHLPPRPRHLDAAARGGKDLAGIAALLRIEGGAQRLHGEQILG